MVKNEGLVTLARQLMIDVGELEGDKAQDVMSGKFDNTCQVRLARQGFLRGVKMVFTAMDIRYGDSPFTAGPEVREFMDAVTGDVQNALFPYTPPTIPDLIA